MFFDYDFRNYNFRLMAYMIALNVIGVLVVRSATNKDPDFVTKQLMGVMVGLVIAICLSLIDYHKILNFSTIIYLLCICSLIAVLIWGKSVNNAKRWIEVPVLGQLQPSEFVKIGLIITFSWYFMKYQEKINNVSTVAIAAALFAVPAMLIFEQPGYTGDRAGNRLFSRHQLPVDRGSFSCNHPYGGNLCLSAFTRSDSFYQRVSGRQNFSMVLS